MQHHVLLEYFWELALTKQKMPLKHLRPSIWDIIDSPLPQSYFLSF